MSEKIKVTVRGSHSVFENGALKKYAHGDQLVISEVFYNANKDRFERVPAETKGSKK